MAEPIDPSVEIAAINTAFKMQEGVSLQFKFTEQNGHIRARAKLIGQLAALILEGMREGAKPQSDSIPDKS